MSSYKRDERGGFLGKSFILILIFFAVIGVAIIDGSSILFARLQLGDVADAAASDGAAACRDTNGNNQAAYQAALATVQGRDPQDTLVVKTFHCDPHTLAVDLQVTRTANTVFIKYIGPLKQLAALKASAHQAPPTL